MSSSRFRPDIEGLRGLAVVMVVAYHALGKYVGGGFVGVDVFFVLSGFLITGLLFREVSSTGRIHLLDFYARRARRLLPAAFVMIAVTVLALLVLYPSGGTKDLRFTAVAATGYWSNYLFLRLSGDYFGGSLDHNPFLHMWSLSVEEQFYLAWPLVIILAAFLARRFRAPRVLPASILFVLVVSFLASLSTGRISAFYRTDLRAWEFAAGALLSVSTARPTLPPAMIGRLGLAALVFSAFFLGFVPSGLAQVFLLVPVLATLMVLYAGSAWAGSSNPLTWSLPRLAGRYSYSWYLWHWPVLVLGVEATGWTSVGARVGLAIFALGIAIVSTLFIEEPFRRRNLAPAPTLRLALRATALLILLANRGLPFPSPSLTPSQTLVSKALRDQFIPEKAAKCRRSSGTGDDVVRICEWDFMSTPGSLGSLSSRSVSDSAIARRFKRVVLYGDSHALHWVDALLPVAALGKWDFFLIAANGCGGGKGLSSDHSCEAWRAAAEDSIRALHADLVLASSSNKYIVDGWWDEDAGERVTPAAWSRSFSGFLDRLNALGIPVVVFQDTPRWRVVGPGECLLSFHGRRDPSSCRVRPEDGLKPTARSAQRSITLARPMNGLVDPVGYLCSTWCNPFVHGTLAYYDQSHLTRAAARTLSDTLWYDLSRTRPFTGPLPQRSALPH